MKIGFFKRIWYAISKIEKYAELSAEGFKKAIKYFIALTAIVAIISSMGTAYRSYVQVKNISKNIEQNAPEFNYSNNTLKIQNDTEQFVTQNDEFGKIIIDTRAEEEGKIEQYISELENEENGVIISESQLILKRAGAQVLKYKYDSLFGQLNINEFNKQELVDYLNSKEMIQLYFNLFAALFIYAFVIYLVNALFYVFLISIVGFFATLMLKIKLRFVAVFNMAIYAVTLPTLLEMLYIGINTFVEYSIPYFDIMYVLVSSIYIIAAIFMLKIELNKKEMQVQKIIEVEKEVKTEMEKEKEEKEENKEENDNKKDKNEQDNNEDENGEEPEGSNA